MEMGNISIRQQPDQMEGHQWVFNAVRQYFHDLTFIKNAQSPIFKNYVYVSMKTLLSYMTKSDDS